MSEDLTWFWAIVDKDGFANVPSSEIDALRIISQKASESDALREEITRLQGLLREAHVKMEANNLWSNLRHRVAAAIREGGND